MSNTENIFKPTKFKKVDWVNVTLTLMLLFGLTLLGCNTVIDHVTPAPIDPIVEDYVEYKVPKKLGFTSLYYIRQMQLRASIKHRTQQLIALRTMQDDKLQYADAINYLNASEAESQTIQDLIIGSENSPFSVAGLLAGLAPGLMVGRAMKRKQDYSPEEVKKLADAVEKRAIDKVMRENTIHTIRTS